MIRAYIFFFGLLVCANASPARAQDTKPQRPNILWITAEDMSPNLGCYGDGYADTPHLDEFALESTRYHHAFATAPVCSPARSCLITGCYATSLGTQRLRSHFPLPDFIRGFPEYLREAGYFTTNNVKTDYNIANETEFIEATWDRNGVDAHWQQRPEGKPFFSVFNLMTTHQSRTGVWPYERFEAEIASQLAADRRHDPAEAPLPPYYPDTLLVRKTVARYYDCISVMDQQVGQILAQLEEDGLADDTIVFFYSDHGMGLPRGKRLLHDSGMRVPMLIRFPEKYRQLAPTAPGETTDQLVSFVDFAPTVLSLVGLEIPTYMQGSPFLGSQSGEPREYVYGARDRVDEVFDVARSVRDQRYLYIRNYMPHLSWMPSEYYSDLSDMRRQLKALRERGELNDLQMTYASPRRAPEELYDTLADPYQLNNLAGSPEHQELLENMRATQIRWSKYRMDLGFLPESLAWERFGHTTPWEWARGSLQRSNGLGLLINYVEDPTLSAKEVLAKPAPDPAMQYWQSIRLQYGDRLKFPPFDIAINDSPIPVYVEEAAARAHYGDHETAIRMLRHALRTDSVDDLLHTVRTLELLGERARPAVPDVQQIYERAKDEEAKGSHPNWMFVRFSAEALLEALDEIEED